MNKQIDLQQIKDGFEIIKDLNEHSFNETLFGSTWLFEHPIILVISMFLIIRVIISIIKHAGDISIGAEIFLTFVYTVIMVAIIVLNRSSEVKPNAQQKLDQKIEHINMSYNEIYNNPTKSVKATELENKYREKIIEIYGEDTMQKLLEQKDVNKQTRKDLDIYLNN